MIRKTIIVVLTLGAVGTCIVFALTRNETLGYGNNRVCITAHYDSISITFATSEKPSHPCLPAKTAHEKWVFRPRTIFLLGTRFIWLPFWQVFIAFAAYPTLAFIRGPLRRYRRRKRGLCVTCGYDLRGSPERCPECGAAS